MRAVIPVAGVGTRLRPHTYTLPKVLLNVAGKPIINHIIDELIVQGIEKVTIVTGYMGKLVEEYLRAKYKLDFTFIKQTSSLGLGHAIWVAKESFKSDPLMIILGDTIFDVNLSHALDTTNSSIGIKEVEDPRRFGVVELNSSGIIKNFIEKPEVPVSKLAIVGLYYIKHSDLLKDCLDELIEKDIRTRDEYQLTDALQLMLQKGEKFTTFSVDGWYDCGKPETLLSTNQFLLEKMHSTVKTDDAVIIPPVYISPTATIKNSVIGPFVTVADDATVEESVLRDTIVSDGATVSSSLLQASIIGNNAVVHGHFTKLNVGNSSEIDY